MSLNKPELIAFSQNVLGGVQSFYYNLLKHDAGMFFDKHWLLIQHKGHKGVVPIIPFDIGETVIECEHEQSKNENALIIDKYITDTPGVILVNHQAELESLIQYPKPNKVVFCMVHDDLYLHTAWHYINVIDVLVTHNHELYKKLLMMFPERQKLIFFLPYGINLSTEARNTNLNKNLTIAFLGRLCVEKGIYDLIEIDDSLKAQNLTVNWVVIGDGPDREKFKTLISERGNFKYRSLKTTDEIFDELTHCDIYILPSVLDGTPVALLESMSVGLVPVLYRFNNGIKKIVTKERGYIVNVGDKEGVVAIIKKLNSNRELLETLSKSTRLFLNKNFDVNIRAQDYYNLFRRFEELKLLRSKLDDRHSRIAAKGGFTLFVHRVIRFAKKQNIKIKMALGG